MSPRVEVCMPRQIPLALFNLPWKMGSILPNTAFPQNMSIRRTHPNCSGTHIEKTGRGPQGQDARGGVLSAVSVLPPDFAPKHWGLTWACSGLRDGWSSAASLAPSLPHLHVGSKAQLDLPHASTCPSSATPSSPSLLGTPEPPI